jgi:hypothetical protein
MTIAYTNAVQNGALSTRISIPLIASLINYQTYTKMAILQVIAHTYAKPDETSGIGMPLPETNVMITKIKKYNDLMSWMR